VPHPASPDAERRWLLEAIELSRYCPPSASAFSVGAVVVAASGALLGAGYSRERDPADHAEEVALARVAESGLDTFLVGATLYSSLEPCAARASRPVPCADLIIASGIRRVVIAWREPPVFVPGGGAVRLRKAGVQVEVIPELAAAARAVNAHLLADLTNPAGRRRCRRRASRPGGPAGRRRSAAAGFPPGISDARRTPPESARVGA
jgi:pyrimidine deaminase RibD-like protein